MGPHYNNNIIKDKTNFKKGETHGLWQLAGKGSKGTAFLGFRSLFILCESEAVWAVREHHSLPHWCVRHLLTAIDRVLWGNFFKTWFILYNMRGLNETVSEVSFNSNLA
jgi:hypothetical protein